MKCHCETIPYLETLHAEMPPARKMFVQQDIHVGGGGAPMAPHQAAVRPISPGKHTPAKHLCSWASSPCLSGPSVAPDHSIPYYLVVVIGGGGWGGGG